MSHPFNRTSRSISNWAFVHAAAPPEWTAAVEPSHNWGLKNEASKINYETAEEFCTIHPVTLPKFLDSRLVDQIRAASWHLEEPSSSRFKGHVKNSSNHIFITTYSDCEDFSLLSNLPIIAGQYNRNGQYGVYYEVTVNRMDPDAVVALGSACRPYPEWRLPGWNRLSAGLHLDDMRKFFEDPNGGRDYTGSQEYLRHLEAGDTFGFGYEFPSGNIFFTRNGGRLPNAFIGEYLPSRYDDPGYDVYAAIGVSGRTEVVVNFGVEPFKWKEANLPQWRVENHVGKLGGSTHSTRDELPAYTSSSRAP
ncbi:hypothetical protein K439DRAFT_1414762 [Ramaria rubella]|nr:hypothetical protein K439DRAFT_1414762 [Ramaria rubella]